MGREASFLHKQDLQLQVTNSDFSPKALEVSKTREPEIPCLELNAESMDLEDNSFDLAVVQDGLHHRPKPVLGLNEMIRIAKKGVAVLEPHTGLVSRFGTTWETQEENGKGATNFVFRWNKELFESTIQSQLAQPDNPPRFESRRLWDHPLRIDKMARQMPKKLQVPCAQMLYGILKSGPWAKLGNSFVGTALWSKDLR